jgi:hypothetical protein
VLIIRPIQGAALTIELDAIQAAPDVKISAESSTDLINWQPTEAGPHFYRLRFDLP